ncbi:MAG: hypothetical protein AB7N76_30470 [Planctomycetota bacterium]
MKRKVLLSSLTVGRCFTLVKEPGGSTEERGAEGATRTGTILAAGDAWRVVEAGDEVACENAAGEAKAFALDTEVVEIPRQGFDKLARP